MKRWIKNYSIAVQDIDGREYTRTYFTAGAADQFILDCIERGAGVHLCPVADGRKIGDLLPNYKTLCEDAAKSFDEFWKRDVQANALVELVIDYGDFGSISGERERNSMARLAVADYVRGDLRWLAGK